MITDRSDGSVRRHALDLAIRHHALSCHRTGAKCPVRARVEHEEREVSSTGNPIRIAVPCSIGLGVRNPAKAIRNPIEEARRNIANTIAILVQSGGLVTLRHILIIAEMRVAIDVGDDRLVKPRNPRINNQNRYVTTHLIAQRAVGVFTEVIDP